MVVSGTSCGRIRQSNKGFCCNTVTLNFMQGFAWFAVILKVCDAFPLFHHHCHYRLHIIILIIHPCRPPICRLLAEKVDEWWVLFCLLHKLSIGFAVVGVINGVFMQETFKAASRDDGVMIRQKNAAVMAHRRKMRTLFSLVCQADGESINQDG